MERTVVDGVGLEYELRGSGDPVVLIHWGLCAAWAKPLLDEPGLAGQHLLLSYHRAGFAGSDRCERPPSLADHAAHCAALMRQLGIERAHVVGHSSSADIALQLALDFPDCVQTLALLEPARPVPPTEHQAQFVREFVAPALEHHRAGDSTAAVDRFATGVFGQGYRERLERGLPGALAQAVADAGSFFGEELPALQQWSFTEEEARRVTAPVLALQGGDTEPTFPPRLELLVSWLPNAELIELADATHLLHVQEPQAVAEALVSFYARRRAAESMRS
jgi:pimeloyl-ACP methyl ester carboxylesterase